MAQQIGGSPKVTLKRAALSEDERRAKKEHIRSMRRSLELRRMIGGVDDLIPFSWRYPLLESTGAKMTKVYREIVATEKALAFRDDRKRS